jgi:hypothetical protein
MRGTSFLGFLLLLPPLAAAGHDAYRTYGQEQDIDITKPFEFSELGWLWQKYSGDTWRIAKAGFDPETWDKYIVPVLKTESVIACAIPAVIFFVVILTLKAMRSGAFALKMGVGGGAKGKKGAEFGYGDSRKAAPMKYKRK